MKIRSVLISAAMATSGALVVLPATAAHAAQPPSTSCWGVVTSQRASTAHDIGEHVSSQDTPHAGLANVAREFGFAGPGELGSFLATIDGDPNTSCS
jgi:hypothetical protein